jgi:hypothetical protein
MLAEVSVKAVDCTVLEVSSSRGVTKLSSSVSSAESIAPAGRGRVSLLGSSSKLAAILECLHPPVYLCSLPFLLLFCPSF